MNRTGVPRWSAAVATSSRSSVAGRGSGRVMRCCRLCWVMTVGSSSVVVSGAKLSPPPPPLATDRSDRQHPCLPCCPSLRGVQQSRGGLPRVWPLPGHRRRRAVSWSCATNSTDGHGHAGTPTGGSTRHRRYGEVVTLLRRRRHRVDRRTLPARPLMRALGTRDSLTTTPASS